MIHSLIHFKNYQQFAQTFPTEKDCLNFLEQIRWNNKPISPFEPTSKVYKCTNNKYKCKTTGKYFNVLTNTIFENTKLPLRLWFQTIFYCLNMTNGISSFTLSKYLGTTQKTSWFLLSRIRYIMNHDNFNIPLKGSIEIDEAYIGGKNINRHKNKKVTNEHGNNINDKNVVLGILQNEITEIKLRPNKNNPERTIEEKVILQPAIIRSHTIPNSKVDTILPIIYKSVIPNSTITTDEHPSYARLYQTYNHELVRHSMKQYVNYEGYTTNHIEGYWNSFKRVWRATYMGRITPKHLHRYCKEVEYRFNTRHLEIAEKFRLLIDGCKKRLRFIDLVNNK